MRASNCVSVGVFVGVCALVDGINEKDDVHCDNCTSNTGNVRENCCTETKNSHKNYFEIHVNYVHILMYLGVTHFFQLLDERIYLWAIHVLLFPALFIRQWATGSLGDVAVNAPLKKTEACRCGFKLHKAPFLFLTVHMWVFL